MSKTITVACNGCQRTKSMSRPEVVRLYDNTKSSESEWALIHAPFTDSGMAGVEELDYCGECWAKMKAAINA